MMAQHKQCPTLDTAVLDRFPSADAVNLQRLLEAAVAGDKHKIIVLDDDPTGVQTVHDLSVYTDWSYESVRQGFLEERKMFYILTNSRGFTEEETIKAHQEIAKTVSQVARELQRPFLLVNRSDSTLRGHYPLETQVLKDQWEAESGQAVDGEILCPYFREGGRFTLGNVHVMAGVPNIFQAMVASVLPKLTGGPPLMSQSLRVNRGEGEIAGPFGVLAAEFPDLSMGSYPFIQNGAHGTNLVIRGTDPGRLAEAMVKLTRLFG